MKKLHELSMLVPAMFADEYEEFKKDLRTNGQAEAIVLFENKILDGRHRYSVLAMEDGVPDEKIKFVQWEPRFDGDTPAKWVESKNMHRRHKMAAGARASLKAALIKWDEAHAQGRPRKDEKPADPAGFSKQADRAKEAGVSERVMRDAETVAKADPDLNAKVARGEVPLEKAVKQVRAAKGGGEPASRGPTLPPKVTKEDKQKARIAELEAEVKSLKEQLATSIENGAEVAEIAANLTALENGEGAQRMKALVAENKGLKAERDTARTENAALVKTVKQLQRQLGARK